MSDDQWNTQLTPAKRPCPKCGLEVSTSVARCPRDGTDLSVRLPEPRITQTNPLADEPFFAGRYEFLGIIGHGGMGVIYKARHLGLKKIVAIKMVHAHLISEEALGRFQIEARATGMLSHPYIIPVFDTGVAETDQPFMIMDFVEGKTLAQILHREGRLPTPRVLKLFIQVAEALSHAHKRNVLHRDIKPSNIMVVNPDTPSEEIRVMDFGIAKLLTENESSMQQLTKTGEAVGSPIYMSPEQARGIKTDSRTDLYSLGCVMYETVVGGPPFMGKTQLDTMLMHLNEDPKPIGEKVHPQSKVDALLERVIMKLLEKNPNERYQSMSELLEDLKAIQAGKAPPNCRSGTRNIPKVKQVNKPLIAGLIAAGVVALTLGGFVVYNTVMTPGKVPAKKDKLVQDPQTSSATARQTIERWVKERKAFINTTGLEHVKDDDLSPLRQPQAAQSIRQLDFANGGFSDEGLEAVKDLKQVQFLNLDDNWVADLHALKNMTDMSILSLRRTHIDPSGMSVIGTLQRLELLSLSGTKINDADLQKLYNLKRLRAVELVNCPNIKRSAIDELQKQLPLCFIAFDHPVTKNEKDPVEFALVFGQPNAMMIQAKVPTNERESNEYKQKMDLVSNELRAGMHLLKQEPDIKYNALALCYQTLGNCLNKTAPDEAKRYYLDALDLFEKYTPDNSNIPSINYQIAVINERKDPNLKVDFELRKKADEFWKFHMGLDVQGYKPFLKIVVRNREAIARYYESKKNDAEAIKTYNSILSTLNVYKLDKSNLAAASINRLADIDYRHKNNNKALSQYLDAIQIYTKQPDARSAEALQDMRLKVVDIYFKEGKYDECLDYAKLVENTLGDPKAKAKLQEDYVDKCTKILAEKRN